MIDQIGILNRPGPAVDLLLRHPHSGEMPGYRERFRDTCEREELTAALYHGSFPPDVVPSVTHVYQEAFDTTESETLKQLQKIPAYLGFSAIVLAKGDEALAVTWWRAIDNVSFYANVGQGFLANQFREHGLAMHTDVLAVLPQQRNKSIGIGLRLLSGDYLKRIAGSEGILETSFISPSNPASESVSLAAGRRPTGVWHINCIKRCWSRVIYPT